MRKVYITISLLIMACTANAQPIKFNIEPYIIRTQSPAVDLEDTCTSIAFPAILPQTDSSLITYVLYRANGLEQEIRQIPMPNAAISELFKVPIDTATLNIILAPWGITIKEDGE